jgi:hypothetical protein
MHRRSSLVVLALSIVVLAVGAYVRSRATSTQAAPAAPDLELLQRLTAERRLRDLSAFLRGVADVAARRLLSPAGLAWDSAIVIALPVPLDQAAMAAVASDGRPVALARAPSASGVPFTIWNAAGSALPRAATVRPKPGDWLLAVARNEAGQPIFAHGLFLGIQPQRCGEFSYEAVSLDASLSPLLIGGGIFAIDGGVAGFIAPCDGRPIAIAASTVSAVLARPVSPADILEQRYGYRLDQDVVTSVWDDSPASAAGLRAGDVVDPAVERPETAKRRGRTLRLAWPAGEQPPATARGIAFDGSTVRSVAAGSPAAAAGIVSGDVIVSPPDPARAIERAKGPIVVTLERGGRRRETLLQP